MLLLLTALVLVAYKSRSAAPLESQHTSQVQFKYLHSGRLDRMAGSKVTKVAERVFLSKLKA